MCFNICYITHHSSTAQQTTSFMVQQKPIHSCLFSYCRLQIHDRRHLQSCVQKDAACVRAGKATHTVQICIDFLQCSTNYVGQSVCVFAGINTRKNTSNCRHSSISQRSYIKRRWPTAQNWLPFSISSCQPLTIFPHFLMFFFFVDFFLILFFCYTVLSI